MPAGASYLTRTVVLFQKLKELTAAGTVAESHGIPFSSPLGEPIRSKGRKIAERIKKNSQELFTND